MRCKQKVDGNEKGYPNEKKRGGKMKFPYKRILIVGCGGAGKSTFARFMGKRFSIPVVHLDKLWWLPGWKERNCDDFDAMLKRELQKPCWIMDGNYLRTLHERLRFADVCILLDIDVETCLHSVRERAQLYAGRSRPDMPDGCPETLHADFEEWIRGFGEQVRPRVLNTIEESGVDFYRFEDRESAEAWLLKFE